MSPDKATKIVLVMGITGAGKSYLIKEISGQDVRVGHSLESCTQQIEQVRCQIGGQPVMILDTPGFDDTHRTDTEVLTEVADFLALLYERNYKVCGIIYLHNISETRMRGSSYKNLQMFGKLCGEGTYSNVVMLTGRWDSIKLADAIKKENELKSNFWKMYLEAGCKLDRYQDKSDLVRIFNAILRNPPVVLDIQHEMVDEYKPLDKTAAGEHVNLELAKQKKKFEAELAAIAADYSKQTKEMKAMMDQDRLKLQAQLTRLEGDKLMLMDNHRRAEEAARAGMQEQYKKLEQEHEKDRIEFQKRIDRAMTEKNQAIRERAEMDAMLTNHQNQMNHRAQERGFWDTVGDVLGNVVGLAIHKGLGFLML